jgi:hypothetical protein
MKPTSDAWSALQAPGVSATNPIPITAIAYADTEAFGEAVVGFHIGAALPDVCFKCASATARRTELRFRAEPGLLATLDAAAAGRAIGSRKGVLRVPHCDACHREIRAGAWKRMFARIAFMMVLVCGVVAASLIGPTAGAVTALVFFASSLVLRFWAWRHMRRSRIVIDRIDTDGFVRIVGVHPMAAEAVCGRCDPSRAAP